MADNPFEIPQQMRDLTEQNLKYANAAYEQLADFMTKSMSAWMGVMPANPAAPAKPAATDFREVQDRAVKGFKEVQDRAVEMAKKNGGAASRLADHISKSRDLQELLTLQTRFAQEQMLAFASQMQELHTLIGSAVRKGLILASRPGVVGLRGSPADQTLRR